MTYGFSHGYSIRSGFPHSDIYGSKLVCQLPEAFRRLPRPSSPVIAKASTTCTCSLDPITGVSLSMGVGALAPTPIRSPEGMEPSLGRPSSLHNRYRLSIRVAPYSKGNLSIPLKIHRYNHNPDSPTHVPISRYTFVNLFTTSS